MDTRRKFIKDSWKWTGLIFAPTLIRAQPRGVFPPTFWTPAPAAAAGGSNNVALVGSQKAGSSVDGSAVSVAVAAPGNVTSGNVILVGVAAWYNSTQAFAAGDLTKTAGTSTVGTIVLDQSNTPTSTNTGSAIFRVPVTGTGSLTLTFNSLGIGGNIFALMGIAEFSGLNATPLDVHNTANGTSANQSTGSISSTVVGVVMYAASEMGNSADFTRTLSDTLIFKVDTASTKFTGIVQYKIISGLTNTLTDTTGSDSSRWDVDYAGYKTS